jgi:hypothetical protein
LIENETNELCQDLIDVLPENKPENEYLVFKISELMKYETDIGRQISTSLLRAKEFVVNIFGYNFDNK